MVRTVWNYRRNWCTDFVNVGVAPQAQLVGVKVLDEGGSGSFAHSDGRMEWTVDKRHDFNIRASQYEPPGGFGLIEWTSSEKKASIEWPMRWLGRA